MKKFFLYVLFLMGGLALVIGLTIGIVIHARGEEKPEGQAGPAAEALTNKIESAVDLAAWREKTRAAEFVFLLTGTRHFRDMGRKLVEVRYKSGGGEYLVQYDEASARRLAKKNGIALRGAALDAAFREARKQHTNDFFWLNPFAALRAPGALRQKVGERALLVTFQSGGETPGDSFLFVTDQTGKPLYFKMWVSIIPLKGFQADFRGWVKTPQGALLSLEHPTFVKAVNLRLKGAYQKYPSENGEDRFKELLTLPK